MKSELEQAHLSPRGALEPLDVLDFLPTQPSPELRGVPIIGVLLGGGLDRDLVSVEVEGRLGRFVSRALLARRVRAVGPARRRPLLSVARRGLEVLRARGRPLLSVARRGLREVLRARGRREHHRSWAKWALGEAPGSDDVLTDSFAARAARPRPSLKSFIIRDFYSDHRLCAFSILGKVAGFCEIPGPRMGSKSQG